MISDPDPPEVAKACPPVTVDTRSTSEVPGGPGSPAEPADLLAKPGTSAASLSALPNLHLQLMNRFSEGSEEARPHLPITAASSKPSSEDGSSCKPVQPAEPLKANSGEGSVKTSTLPVMSPGEPPAVCSGGSDDPVKDV